MNHTIKYWLFFSIGICLLLQSCNDDKSPVYEFTAAPELSPLDASCPQDPAYDELQPSLPQVEEPNQSQFIVATCKRGQTF